MTYLVTVFEAHCVHVRYWIDMHGRVLTGACRQSSIIDVVGAFGYSVSKPCHG